MDYIWHMLARYSYKQSVNQTCGVVPVLYLFGNSGIHNIAGKIVARAHGEVS